MKFLRKSLHVRHPPIPNHSDHRSRLTAQTSSFSSVGCVGPGASLNMCSHTPKLLISHILYIYIYSIYYKYVFFRSGHGGGWVFTIYRRSYVLSYLESTLWMRSIYCSQFMDAMGTKKKSQSLFRIGSWTKHPTLTKPIPNHSNMQNHHVLQPQR